MTTISGLPTIAAGAHEAGSGEACVMEYVSILAGELFSDSPSCTHPVLARAAQKVNDTLPDEDRHLLAPLIGRLFGTAETGAEGERIELSIRLAVWAARRVLPLVREQDRAVCKEAIDMAEGVANGTATKEKARRHLRRHLRRHAYAADAATYAAYATYAADAAAYAEAAAAAAAAAYARVDFLSGLIDEYDRLTGRTTHRELSDDDLRTLAAAAGHEIGLEE